MNRLECGKCHAGFTGQTGWAYLQRHKIHNCTDKKSSMYGQFQSSNNRIYVNNLQTLHSCLYYMNGGMDETESVGSVRNKLSIVW